MYSNLPCFIVDLRCQLSGWSQNESNGKLLPSTTASILIKNQVHYNTLQKQANPHINSTLPQQGIKIFLENYRREFSKILRNIGCKNICKPVGPKYTLRPFLRSTSFPKIYLERVIYSISLGRGWQYVVIKKGGPIINDTKSS